MIRTPTAAVSTVVVSTAAATMTAATLTAATLTSHRRGPNAADGGRPVGAQEKTVRGRSWSTPSTVMSIFSL